MSEISKTKVPLGGSSASPFGRAVDRIRPLRRIDTRRGGMLADRIGPLAKPPIYLLALAGGGTERRSIVITSDIVDLLAPMLLQNRVLTDDLGSLLIVGRVPKACIVAEVQRDVPFNGRATERAALLRLAECLGQRFGVDWRWLESNQTMLDPCAHSFISSDVAVADDPEVERRGLLMRCGRLRDGSDHGRRQGQGRPP